MSERFPYTQPDGSDLGMFIQWKGTELCADFTCPCGHGGHIDAAFAYYVRCGGCGAVYEMGTQVIARRDEHFDENDGPVQTFGADLFEQPAPAPHSPDHQQH